MPYRRPSPPPALPPPPEAPTLGRVERACGVLLFCVAMSWIADLGLLLAVVLHALHRVTPTGHELARAFGP